MSSEFIKQLTAKYCEGSLYYREQGFVLCDEAAILRYRTKLSLLFSWSFKLLKKTPRQILIMDVTATQVCHFALHLKILKTYTTCITITKYYTSLWKSLIMYINYWYCTCKCFSINILLAVEWHQYDPVKPGPTTCFSSSSCEVRAASNYCWSRHRQQVILIDNKSEM